MKLAAALFTAAALTVTGAAAGTPKPSCHWTHSRSHGVNIYTQVCSVPKHKRHHVNPRWTSAGPSNSTAPRIG